MHYICIRIHTRTHARHTHMIGVCKYSPTYSLALDLLAQMTAAELSQSKLSWCRVCGNNVHTQCMDMWANQKRRSGQEVTCCFCRAPWHNDAAAKAKSTASASSASASSASDVSVTHNGDSMYLNLGRLQGQNTSRSNDWYRRRWRWRRDYS